MGFSDTRLLPSFIPGSRTAPVRWARAWRAVPAIIPHNDEGAKKETWRDIMLARVISFQVLPERLD
jgi:hypothetical protein